MIIIINDIHKPFKKVIIKEANKREEEVKITNEDLIRERKKSQKRNETREEAIQSQSLNRSFQAS